MRATQRILACAFCGILVSGGCGGGPNAAAPTGEKITLKLNLKPGDSKTALMDIDMDISAEGQDVDMGMGMEFTLDVQEVSEEGEHTALFTYDRVKMNMSGGGMNMNYDSENPADPDEPVAQIFGAMINQPLTVKISALGKVNEVQGIDAIADGIADPALRAEMRSQLQETENQLGQIVATFPDHPVDNGDTWTGVIKQGGQTPMTINPTYTLMERKNGEAVVDVAGDLSGTLSGEMTGTLNIDLATGWTNSGKLNMKASGSQGGASVTLDMTVDMSSR